MSYDVVVIGAGPNGLSAAILLARSGLRTLVVEARATPGGGARSAALTEPGFVHDVCSAVHPLGIGSPLFRQLRLERHGLSWIHSPAPLAHVLDDGHAVLLERSLDRTAEQLGADGAAYRRLMAPFVEHFTALARGVLGPVRIPPELPILLRFARSALRSLRGLARARFRQRAAPALLAGIATHGMVPLDAAATSAFALLLGSAGHAVGWPIPRGGSQAISDALAACFREHGGELRLESPVERLEQLPAARAYVFDVAPKQLLRITGSELPSGYRRRLERFRYGPGVFKLDWALSGPVPWRDPACARASTVHLAGTLDEIAAAEAAVHAGRVPERPFVLLVQPSLFDASRAPEGRHTLWAYCHVPHASTAPAAAAIEAQIERAAPGFEELVLARAAHNAADMAAYNPNYVGGDINGGLSGGTQLLFRPVARLDPYATPSRRIFLCSSSTPPGGGVHGMCGYYAARSVLRRAFGRKLDA